jgi:plasmid stabilization system protein ParE
VKLFVSAAAATDIERLYNFVVDKSPAVAQRVVTILSDAIQSLEYLPERGRPSGQGGSRELVVPFGKTAFVVRYVYFAQAEEIVIVRIWDGRELRE